MRVVYWHVKRSSNEAAESTVSRLEVRSVTKCGIYPRTTPEVIVLKGIDAAYRNGEYVNCSGIESCERVRWTYSRYRMWRVYLRHGESAMEEEMYRVEWGNLDEYSIVVKWRLDLAGACILSVYSVNEIRELCLDDLECHRQPYDAWCPPLRTTSCLRKH